MRHPLSIMHHRLSIIRQHQSFTISLRHAITAMDIVMRQLFHTNIIIMVMMGVVVMVMAGVIVTETIMMVIMDAAIGASF